MADLNRIVGKCAKAFLFVVMGVMAIWGAYLIYAMFFLFSLLNSMCEDVTVSSVRSPNGVHAAAIHTRNCGATTGYSYFVTVGDASQTMTPDDGSNVVLTATDAPNLSLHWNSDKQLTIYGMPGQTDKVFKQKHNWYDIQISYP